jgi:alginate O-acetyltransferase complex protein AlgI
MLLGGLWHGAAWNFVVWGGLHGAWLVMERSRLVHSAYGRLPSAVRVVWTFLLVLVGWVFFRASDLPAAARYLGHMVGIGSMQDGAGLLGGLLYQPYFAGTMALAAAIIWLAPQALDWTRTLTWRKAVSAFALFLLSVAALTTQAYNPFIYFIF